MRTSIRGILAATLLAGTSLAAAPAFAQDAPEDISVSANVALTTDYRFRGVSLSGGDPAIQGGITVSHSSGIYVSTWSSSIEGGDVFGSQELDLIAGWSGEVSSGITLDGGMLYYAYPNGHVGKANYWEPYASVAGTVGPATVKVGVAYAWEQESLGDEDNLYVYGNADFGIPNTPVTLSGHLGYTDGALAPKYLAGSDEMDGFDWSLGASMTLFGPLSASVTYVGVNAPSYKGFTDDTVVGTLTASF